MVLCSLTFNVSAIASRLQVKALAMWTLFDTLLWSQNNSGSEIRDAEGDVRMMNNTFIESDSISLHAEYFNHMRDDDLEGMILHLYKVGITWIQLKTSLTKHPFKSLNQ